MKKQPNLTQTRLRYSLDGMTDEQRKLIRLPHVGAKEIARHDWRLLTAEMCSHVALQQENNRNG